MRLTVHVTGAKKETVEVKTQDGYKKQTRTMNTLSFSGVGPEDVDRILAEIESEGYGTPTRHYLSGEKIRGRARGKKKS